MNIQKYRMFILHFCGKTVFWKRFLEIQLSPIYLLDFDHFKENEVITFSVGWYHSFEILN